VNSGGVVGVQYYLAEARCRSFLATRLESGLVRRDGGTSANSKRRGPSFVIPNGDSVV
jgi:hypothetical protein